MDIVVRGRNVEVPDHYRQHVADKLSRVERYDHKLMKIDVELYHEKNPRQSDSCQRVQITCKSRGPVVRSESRAQDFYAALDMAVGRLDTRLRRTADRRRVHHGSRSPLPVSTQVTTDAPDTPGTMVLDAPAVGPAEEPGTAPDRTVVDTEGGDGGPGRVVRVKEHPAKPMTLDQALLEMELVGHDFYLFNDLDSGRPSVVYRRIGFDYGVIRLTE